MKNGKHEEGRSGRVKIKQKVTAKRKDRIIIVM